MKMKFYPPEDGFSAEQVRRGHIWIYADVTCPWCGKEQPVAATQFVGGPCVQCGLRTDGSAAPGARVLRDCCFYRAELYRSAALAGSSQQVAWVPTNERNPAEPGDYLVRYDIPREDLQVTFEVFYRAASGELVWGHSGRPPDAWLELPEPFATQIREHAVWYDS